MFSRISSNVSQNLLSFILSTKNPRCVIGAFPPVLALYNCSCDSVSLFHASFFSPTSSSPFLSMAWTISWNCVARNLQCCQQYVPLFSAYCWTICVYHVGSRRLPVCLAHCDLPIRHFVGTYFKVAGNVFPCFVKNDKDSFIQLTASPLS